METDAVGGARGDGVRVPMMYHPSHDVLDLDAAEAWYARVFGVPSKSLKSLMASLPPRPGSGYPPDYSTFTLIGDVLFDTIDPTRYLIGGSQRLPSVATPHLRLISWYLDDMDAGFRALRRLGLTLTNQVDEIVEGDSAPTAFGSDMRLFYTRADETGLRYSFSPPAAVTASDPRSRPGWALAEPVADDPLGLRFCSHHTILTSDPQRGVRLHCEGLGGIVIHEGRNAQLGSSSTWVHLGGSTIEFAVPDRGTPASADWQTRAPHDCYHALTWLVRDLDRAAAHLTRQGIAMIHESPHRLIVDPKTALGIPWGFTTRLTQGDPRHA